MKENYKTTLAVKVELVLDDTHDLGKKMKYAVTREPEVAAQVIASVINNIFQVENAYAKFAKLNVIGVSELD